MKPEPIKTFLPIHKRMIYGNLIILMGTIGAILVTFAYTWFIDKYPRQQTRFDFIFGISGGILACSAIVSALLLYTNNFNEGFVKYTDNSEKSGG